MAQEIQPRERRPAAPRDVTPKLNLERLDALQRWLQYGALLVLLVVVFFIVVALLGLRRINREIADKQAQSSGLQASIEALKKEQDELLKTNAALGKENEKLKPFVVAYDNQGQSATQLAAPGPAQLPARIYLHIGSILQSDTAKKATNQLRLKGYVVPDIENVGPARSPEVSQVRYYEAADPGATEQAERDADDIVAAVRASIGVELEKKRFPYSRNVRPRHYEIWFGNNYYDVPPTNW